MAYAPRKKPLDFDGNLDKVTLGLELEYRVRVTVRWWTGHARVVGYVSPDACLIVTILRDYCYIHGCEFNLG